MVVYEEATLASHPPPRAEANVTHTNIVHLLSREAAPCGIHRDNYRHDDDRGEDPRRCMLNTALPPITDEALLFDFDN